MRFAQMDHRMAALGILLLAFWLRAQACDETVPPVLYYYGIEESERSLPRCAARQACAALLQRYWRAPALLRLCRCARRQRCDARAAADRLVELNNRAQLQFCLPVNGWPKCTVNGKALTVVTPLERMNPDELEELHHQNVHLTPPRVTFDCLCPSPNYWKLNSTQGHVHVYRCSSLPVCRTDEFCGNVSDDLNALYQSCLCPKHHICVHDGGVTHARISELLYRGEGWKAYCRRLDADYSYEDY